MSSVGGVGPRPRRGPGAGPPRRVSVVVVTDSTAYLPPELTEGYGIHVVPLYVVLPGRSGREGLDVSPKTSPGP